MAHWSPVLRPLCSTGYSALMIRAHLKDDESDKPGKADAEQRDRHTSRGAIQGQQVVDRQQRDVRRPGP